MGEMMIHERRWPSFSGKGARPRIAVRAKSLKRERSRVQGGLKQGGTGGLSGKRRNTSGGEPR